MFNKIKIEELFIFENYYFKKYNQTIKYANENQEIKYEK